MAIARSSSIAVNPAAGRRNSLRNMERRPPARRMAATSGYCLTAGALLSPTVTSRLSLRKLFSPLPFTFINSSIFFFEDSQLNIQAGEREVRPPAAPTT